MKGRRFCALHGHQFDKMCFIFSQPLIDKTFGYFTRFLKRVKFWGLDLERRMNDFHIRFSEKIALKVRKYAIRHGYDTIICGHTHVPLYCLFEDKGKEIQYFNCGGWIGTLHTYLTIDHQGVVQLHSA